MGEIRVRLAFADDLDAVFALDRAIENLPHWTLADYRAAIAQPMVIAENQPQLHRGLFVAERKGMIEGLAVGVVRTVAGDCWAEIETVGVVPQTQRRGMGRELCQTVIDWCHSHGAAHIDLEVRNCSTGAIALYAGLGFEIEGRRPRYYRAPEDDALLMRLNFKQDRP